MKQIEYLQAQVRGLDLIIEKTKGELRELIDKRYRSGIKGKSLFEKDKEEYLINLAEKRRNIYEIKVGKESMLSSLSQRITVLEEVIQLTEGDNKDLVQGTIDQINAEIEVL